MIKHITFASENMSISAEVCRKSALAHGCDVSRIYGKEDIFGTDFLERNYDILTQNRGVGYWLWKPYFILQELETLSFDDFLIYTDAGVEFVNHVDHLINSMDDILLFQNNYKHSEWCKGDVMAYTPDYSGNQVQASAMIFKVCDQSIYFVDTWLNRCEIPGLIDDSPSKLPNYPGFQEHRHDQAILTSVAVQKNIPLHWWPAQYLDGKFTYDKNGLTDNYPVIFHHHRKRNDEWK